MHGIYESIKVFSLKKGCKDILKFLIFRVWKGFSGYTKNTSKSRKENRKYNHISYKTVRVWANTESFSIYQILSAQNFL